MAEKKRALTAAGLARLVAQVEAERAARKAKLQAARGPNPPHCPEKPLSDAEIEIAASRFIAGKKVSRRERRQLLRKFPTLEPMRKTMSAIRKVRKATIQKNNLRLPAALYDRIGWAASWAGVSRNEMMLRLLDLGLWQLDPKGFMAPSEEHK